MITADRSGATLPSEAIDVHKWGWSCRVAATNGVYTSKTGWTYHEMPPGSLISRSRSSALDGGTWELSLEVLADALPDATDPLAYYQLELDLVDYLGRHWPYFTGPIDHISDPYTIEQDGGAIIHVQRIEAHGVLQRGKGMRVNGLVVTPARVSFTGQMTIIAQAVTTSVSKTSSTNTVFGALHTVDATVGTGSFPGIVVDDTASFASPLTYGAGASEYTITATDGQPLQINWGGSVANGTYYVKYWSIVRIIVGSDFNNTRTPPTFIRLPDGNVAYSGSDSIPRRRVFDTFQTYAAAGCTTTAITVKDPESYKSGKSLVAISGGPTEHLVWTKTDGTEEVKQISSTSAAGVITLSSGFSAAPAAGDPIRLGTCEGVRAWEIWNRDASQTASQAKFYSDSGKTTEFSRNSFGYDPRTGTLIPLVGRHYDSATEGIWVGNGSEAIYTIEDIITSTSLGATDNNRIENLYYLLLTDDSDGASLNLLATGDFSNDGATGGFFKSYVRYDTTLDDILDEVGKNGLPPNAFCHDTPAGKVRVDAFTQSTTPDLVLGNSQIRGIEIASLPEPRTGVAVISKGPPRNIAGITTPTWTAADWTSPERLFDGTQGSAATNTISSTVYIDVSVPLAEMLPHITSMKIHATAGVVSIKAERYDRTNRNLTRSRMVEGFGYLVLNNGVTEIPGERINDALVALAGAGTDYMKLALTFYQDNSNGGSVNPSVSEIEVFSDVETGWGSYITDDSSGSPPTSWTTEDTAGFGQIWWQRADKDPKSYRFCNAAYAKRVFPKYGGGVYSSQLHRLEKLVVDQITQDECRDYAERYMDEYIRQGREFRVSIVHDPRIDLGDTIHLALPDGTSRNLFVWAMSDGGSMRDFDQQLTLLDYAA